MTTRRQTVLLCLLLLLAAPLAAAEPTTIHEIQSGAVSEGTAVLLEAVTVTAVHDHGLAVAEAPYGALNGIWIYTGGAPGVQPGDVVNVVGDYVEYYDFSEVNVPDSGDPEAGVTVVAAGTVPTPSDLAAAALLAAPEDWEGCVVRVTGGLTVVDPDLGYGEWLVATDDGSLSFRCDDYWYEEEVLLGQHYTAVTGLWNYNYSNYKLEVFADGVEPSPPTAGETDTWSIVKRLYR